MNAATALGPSRQPGPPDCAVWQFATRPNLCAPLHLMCVPESFPNRQMHCAAAVMADNVPTFLLYAFLLRCNECS